MSITGFNAAVTVGTAPAIAGAGAISPASGPVGTVFTLTAPTASGTPAPTVTLTALTQAGVDVLASVVGGTFTSTAAGALVATWTASNGVNPPATGTANATVTVASALWGARPVAYSTTGDVYVDTVNGLDTNSGASMALAKKTIQAGVNAIASGVVKIAAGTYRETVALKSDITLEAHGSAVPVIDCSDPMTSGWVACTSGDAAIAGANWAMMLKKTGIPVSSFPQSDPMNANLFAGATRLNLARKYGLSQNTSVWCRAEHMFKADTVIASAGSITGFTHAALAATYTAAQLQAAIVVVQNATNLLSFRKCTVSGSTFTLSASVPQSTATSYGWDNLFGFMNLIPAMEEGGWGYVWDGVASTCDLYVWLPAGKIAADISASARTNAMTAGALINVTVRGLTMTRMSGSMQNMEGGAITGYYDFGCGIAAGTTGTARSNFLVENCSFTNGWQQGMGPSNYAHCGAVSIVGCTGVTVRQCTFDDLQASEGVVATYGTNVLVEWCDFNKVFREDFWPHSSTFAAMMHCRHRGSTYGHNHNNAFAHYKGASGLEWGNIWEHIDAYATWQDGANFAYCYNVFEADGSSQSIRDQSGSLDGRAVTYGVLMINNTVVYPTTRDPNSAIGYGQSILVNEDGFQPVSILNNVYYGASVGTLAANGNNINTSASQSLPAATGNLSEAIDTTFANRAARDYSIKAGSAVRASAGSSVAAIVSDLQAKFPFVTDWTDPWGNAINFAAPRIGAMVNPDQNPVAP